MGIANYFRTVSRAQLIRDGLMKTGRMDKIWKAEGKGWASFLNSPKSGIGGSNFAMDLVEIKIRKGLGNEEYN